MRRILLLLLTLTLSLAFGHDVQAQHEPPYLYYYSDVLNAFVVERADGSDSRVLGAGLMPDDTNQVDGAGWSPSGEWFMWNAVHAEEGNSRDTPFIVSTDGSQLLHALDSFIDIDGAYAVWSPTADLLLFIGEDYIDSRFAWRFVVVDANTDSIIANHIHPVDSDEGFFIRNIGWSADGGQVAIYFTNTIVFLNPQDNTLSIEESNLLEMRDLNFLWILPTSTDGEAEAQIASPYPSPDGCFTSAPRTEYNYGIPQISGYCRSTRIFFPQHSGATGANNPYYLWHPSSDWLFIVEDATHAGGCCYAGASSVARSDGTYHRELNMCELDVNRVCVNWLPDTVLPHLTPGLNMSVVQQPVRRFVFENTRIFEVEWNTPDSLTLTNNAGWNYSLDVFAADESEFRNAGGMFVSSNYDSARISRGRVRVEPSFYQRLEIVDLVENTRLACLNTFATVGAFSPDGRWLALASRNILSIWEMREVFQRSNTDYHCG